MKMTKSWTGKKDSLPSFTKKDQHKQRKTFTQLLHILEDKDWEEQLKEYKRDELYRVAKGQG